MPIEDHPILRLLFAATRHTEAAGPTTTAVIAAQRTAARQGGTTHLPRAKPGPGAGRQEAGCCR
ncbi:hypothetical protein RKD22_006701 [Streptomyces pristinaespiralis]